jgi:hypothetical protein
MTDEPEEYTMVLVFRHTLLRIARSYFEISLFILSLNVISSLNIIRVELGINS